MHAKSLKLSKSTASLGFFTTRISYFMKKEKDWFRLKKYPHIGVPLKNSDRKIWIEQYVTDSKKVAKHGFLPFIHIRSKVRKFRRSYSEQDGLASVMMSNSLTRKPLKRTASTKARDLHYASHLDSLIYNYYTKLLSDKYEKKILLYGINEVVSAYRSIPVNPNDKNSSNKCNVDFAQDVFSNITSYPHDEFVAIALDISSFFDHLNHKKLLEVWADVLDLPHSTDPQRLLPGDHYNVYKNITRYSYIEINDLFQEFNKQIITQKRNNQGKLLPEKIKKISSPKHLKNQNAIAFCTKENFLRIKNRPNLIKSNKYYINGRGEEKLRNFGIPQGSSISSVLANMYLLHFDKLINDTVTDKGGSYRRYSDDMVVVCAKEFKTEIIELIKHELSNNYHLTVQDSKTQIFHFKKDNSKLICGQEFKKEINWNKNFIYLGLEFDGSNTLLKSASIGSFYRKLKKGILRSKHYAGKNNKNTGVIFKQRIFKRYSYKGAKRYRKYIWDKHQKKFEKTEYYNWGNYISYVKKAESVIKNGKIKKQLKRHWNLLNKLLRS